MKIDDYKNLAGWLLHILSNYAVIDNYGTNNKIIVDDAFSNCIGEENSNLD